MNGKEYLFKYENLMQLTVKIKIMVCKVFSLKQNKIVYISLWNAHTYMPN